MSIMITQSADSLFTVVISDIHARPAALPPAVRKHCRLRSIKALLIAPSTNTAAWRHALAAIVHYFVQGSQVQTYQASTGVVVAAATPTPGTTSLLNSIGGTVPPNTQPVPPMGSLFSPFNAANQAALFQMRATDMQDAQTIYPQVAADAQKQQAERWRIMQDTQTAIFQITQDVTVNKAKTADKAFASMDGYIRG